MSGDQSIPFLTPEQNDREVLFVGNSYTMSSNLPHIVKAFLAERGITATLRKSTVGGATFEEHWNEKRELRSRQHIQSGKFSIVILQANSRAALDQREETLDYGARLIAEVREHGGFPLLYQTWARMDSIKDQELISGMYREISETHDVPVVPVGRAWELMRHEWPIAPLFSADGHHPTAMGTYIAACAMFELLSGQDCTGLPNQPIVDDGDGEFIILMWIDPEHATLCQRMAHQAVAELKSQLEANAKI